MGLNKLFHIYHNSKISKLDLSFTIIVLNDHVWPFASWSHIVSLRAFQAVRWYPYNLTWENLVFCVILPERATWAHLPSRDCPLWSRARKKPRRANLQKQISSWPKPCHTIVVATSWCRNQLFFISLSKHIPLHYWPEKFTKHNS